MKKISAFALYIFVTLLSVCKADLEANINKMCESAELYAREDNQEAVEQLYLLTLKSQARLYQSNKYQRLLDISSKALKEKSNHAEYIKSKIHELSENPLTVSQFKISGFFEVASHLKSSQMVYVLGEFLYDDRNAKPKVKWEPGMDIAPNDAASNSWAAAKALQSMGIKNPPQTDDRGYPIIDSWKEWFEEVKAGTRTFSFEGENVAYRMKDDGTFDTLAATAVSEKSQRIIEKNRNVPKITSETSTRKTTWIVFSTLLVLLTGLYYMKFRKTSG